MPVLGSIPLNNPTPLGVSMSFTKKGPGRSHTGHPGKPFAKLRKRITAKTLTLRHP